MTPFLFDSSLYNLCKNGELIGLSREYIDDLLPAGSQEFRSATQKNLECFRMGEDEHIPCTFSGVSLDLYKEILTRYETKLLYEEAWETSNRSHTQAGTLNVHATKMASENPARLPDEDLKTGSNPGGTF